MPAWHDWWVPASKSNPSRRSSLLAPRDTARASVSKFGSDRPPPPCEKKTARGREPARGHACFSMAGFPPDPLQAAWQRNISHNGARGEYQAVAAPTWVPDSAVAGCMVCSAKFSLTRRRHHCRRCGACVCDSCGRARVPSSALSGSRALDAPNDGSTRAVADELLVKGTYLEYVRVCSPCAKVIDVQLSQALRARGRQEDRCNSAPSCGGLWCSPRNGDHSRDGRRAPKHGRASRQHSAPVVRAVPSRAGSRALRRRQRRPSWRRA